MKKTTPKKRMEREVKRMKHASAAAAAAAPIDDVINLLSDSESDEDVETQIEILDLFPGSASSTTPSSRLTPPPPSTTTTLNIAGMKENLKCNICFEVFCDPITLVPCAHVFCGGCFSEWAYKSCTTTTTSSSHRGPFCPSCRKHTTMVMDAAKNLTSIVEEYFVAFPEEQRSKEDIAELKRKDTLPRGKPLSSSYEPVRYSSSRQQHASSNVPFMYIPPQFDPQQRQQRDYPPYANPMPYHPFSVPERYANARLPQYALPRIPSAAASPVQPVITPSLIQRFVQLTGCTVQEANAYLTLAFQQHFSFEHAVQSYLDSRERY